MVLFIRRLFCFVAEAKVKFELYDHSCMMYDGGRIRAPFLLVLLYFVSGLAFKLHWRRSVPNEMILFDHNSSKCDLDVRINKCMPGLSRRAADAAITENKVTINSYPATIGSRVRKGDIVKYNGVVQNWRSVAVARNVRPSKAVESREFIYIKYWKPVGVTCTSDMKDSTNIISAGNFNLLPQRVFNVGRLDKESSGIILMTSDGRVNNAMLNSKCYKEKTYIVNTNIPASDEQILRLSTGVVITTPIQRDCSKSSSKSAEVTALTLPCYVKRIPVSATHGVNALQITLREGRNRQIRRMAEAVGLRVDRLHRTSFAGIGLKGVSVGNWAELTSHEMNIIIKAIE